MATSDGGRTHEGGDGDMFFHPWLGDAKDGAAISGSNLGKY